MKTHSVTNYFFLFILWDILHYLQQLLHNSKIRFPILELIQHAVFRLQTLELNILSGNDKQKNKERYDLHSSYQQSLKYSIHQSESNHSQYQRTTHSPFLINQSFENTLKAGEVKNLHNRSQNDSIFTISSGKSVQSELFMRQAKTVRRHMQISLQLVKQ